MTEQLPVGEGDTAPTDSVLSRSFRILDEFRKAPIMLGTSEIARRTGVAKSTTHRLLGQMVEAGFLERQGSKYRVGIKLFEIGNYAAFCEPGGMRDTALPFISSLYVRGGDCVVTLAVRSSDRILCIEKIRGHSSPRTETRIGWPIPATQSSLGRVILAFSPKKFVRQILEQGLEQSTPNSIVDPKKFLKELQEIRATGVSFDHQETLVGLSGVSSPVFLGKDIVASVALTQKTSAFRPEYAKQLVTTTAEQLGTALGRAANRREYMPSSAIT